MAAVVSASHGVLGPLVKKLTNLLADECARLKGVRREIKLLKSELVSMHGAVEKYTTLQDPDIQVKQWISLVRELAYDTEDVIDKFIHNLGKGGDHDGGFKGFLRKAARQLKTLGSRHGIANEIDDLKARVKQVKELKNCYKLDDIVCDTSGHTTIDPRLSALFTEEEHLVGIDGPRDDLTNWMLDEDKSSTKHLKVLSIVGFGGLGKTTLANEVYRRIKGYFQCHAFVSVSQKPDEKRIIKNIISQLSCEKDFIEHIDTWEIEKCIAKLRELLQDKRYLVVIDDIWSIPTWNSIKYAFPKNNHSSRIMTTTRIVDVARSCCPSGNDRLYEMEALSEDHSKRLFFNRIFGSEHDCPSMLKDISNEILKKCGGLPLAITSLSSLLASKPIVKDEWEKVKRSIGSALDKSGSLMGINSILSLSYNDLPPHLRTCLLYLSIFPEDHEIGREDLVMRWMAEGFISEERGRTRHEVAESYFYELINRNMVQPLYIGVDGKVGVCRVHDMMLELIILKSAEDNFVTVIGGGQPVLGTNHGSIRRLSVQNSDRELASVLANEDLSHVRCLTVTASSCVRHLPSLAKFKSLRVLDFGPSDIEVENFMKDIGELFNLKYLNLGHTPISNLPSGIVMLHDLETLDLRNTLVHELPARIIQLTKLQHLLLPRYQYDTKIPDGIGNMKNLRVISFLNITNSSVGVMEELGNLAGLEVLHVRLHHTVSLEHKVLEMLASSLAKLGNSKLQSFSIFSESSTSLQFLDYCFTLPSSLQRFVMMSINYFLPKTPKWIAPAPTSLTYLDLILEKVTEEDLRIVGELPALLSLNVTFKGAKRERLTIGSIAFPCLKEFYLRCYVQENSAIYLTFEEGALPKLEMLQLPLCVSMAKSYGFYLGLGHLRCLRHAGVVLCLEVDTSSESCSAEAAIRKEANSHPNHPRVTIWDETEVKENDEEESFTDEEES